MKDLLVWFTYYNDKQIQDGRNRFVYRDRL